MKKKISKEELIKLVMEEKKRLEREKKVKEIMEKREKFN